MAAIIAPEALFEFKVVPFCHCSAAAAFEPVVDTALAGITRPNCFVCLDNEFFFRSSEQHMRRPETVLEAIKSPGLTLEPEKFGFACK